MGSVFVQFSAIKTLVRNVVLITLPTIALALLVLELVFRFIIPASNPPQGVFDNEFLLYRWDSDYAQGYYSYGALARLRILWKINGSGWNSSIEYSESKDRSRIAVIGDSFIQSLIVDVDENYPSLLRDELKDSSDVYSFGIAGAQLSQYLHMSRYVRKMFNPDVFIFNVVHNDFYNSLYSRKPNNIHWLRLKIDDSGVKEISPRPDYSFSQFNMNRRLLKNSALIRYVFLNLNGRYFMRNLFGMFGPPTIYSANIDINVLQETKERVKVATAYVLSHIKAENPGKRIIIVMDAPRDSIYGGSESSVEFLHNIMQELTAANDVEFIDLSESMRDTYTANHRQFNPPFDNHWNEYGHEFVFTQVLAQLTHRINPVAH